MIEGKKAVRLVAYQRCMSSVSFWDKWSQRRACTDVWGAAELIYPWDPAILQGTPAENSKLDLYMDAAETPYPLAYLRIWQKHKAIENLIVQGAGRLVGEMIAKEATRYSYQPPKATPKMEAINWKEKRPAKMLGLAAEEFRWCTKMGWNMAELELYREAGAAGIKMNMPADMETCRKAGVSWCMKMIREKMPMLRSARYIVKQVSTHQNVTVRELEDYWDMAQTLGYNMADSHVRYPKDLMRAHDRLIAEVREKKKQELDKENALLAIKFDKLAEELQPMAWQDGGIMIRPAASPVELDMEGKTLNHCVARYKNTHAKGEHVIFFIREEERPEQPWYTLELDLTELKVLQNRGKHNCARTTEVEAFEKAWLEHIRTSKHAAEMAAAKGA